MTRDFLPRACRRAEGVVRSDRDNPSETEASLLRKLVDNIPAMVAYWDANLRCRFANRAYEDWFGFKPEHLRGRHISELLGSLYPLHLPHIERALRGEPQEFERDLSLQSKDAARIASIHYVPDVVEGKVRGFFVLVTDITALKVATQALRESEERFRLTIDEAPIGMALVSPSGRALRVNRAFSELLGYSISELEGMSVGELTYPPDLAADLELFSQLFAGKIQRYRIEKRYVRKDGQLVNALLSVSAVRAPDGQPIYFIAQIEDVTERKRLAEELRVAEQISSGILAISADAIITIDEKQRIVMFNKSAERAFGRSAADVLGQPLDLLIPERFRKVHQLHVAKFSAGEEVARHTSDRGIEVIGLRENGEEFPADATISKLVIDGRKLLTVALRDITEQRQAQATIRQAQERLELAQRGADLGSWDWNIQTGELVVNRRWAEMLDYDPEELRLRVDTWKEVVHPEDWSRIERDLDDYFRGRTQYFEGEYRLRKKSGDFIWVLDRGKLFTRDEQGRPLRMVGTILDITERKRINDGQAFLAEVSAILASSLQLEETLGRLAHVTLGTFADCVIVDVADDEDEGRVSVLVVHVDPEKNPLCEQIRRTRLARWRAPTGAAKPSQEKATLVSDVDERALVALAESEEDLKQLRELGPKSLISVPLRGHERVLGTLTFISTSARRYGQHDFELARDLAYRAGLALDNARLYETARRATRLRDEVLGVVAHDLRNPLGTILMQVALLRRKTSEPKRALETLERSARRMNRLIEDLLEVTKLEASELALDRALLDPKKLLADCVEGQAVLAASAKLTLELELEGELPALFADKDRLLQVLENLIGNAMKFTPEGGKVTVGATLRGEEVLFWVKDTGRGIAPEDMPHVFERFWQARKGEHLGAGLGLQIVKGIVEAHGGSVWVESEEGRGSVFFFTLPHRRFAEAPERC
jgi:PAS domain S-box-containing protein